MLWFKKPEVSKARIADIIEYAIISRAYDVHGYYKEAWMCMVASTLSDRKVITYEEYLAVCEAIQKRLGPKRSILRNHLADLDPGFRRLDAFETRITMMCWWWRFLRELRGQSQLSEMGINIADY